MMLTQKKASMGIWLIISLALALLVLFILGFISIKGLNLSKRLDVCQNGYYVPKDKCNLSRINDSDLSKELTEFQNKGKICCPTYAIDEEYLKNIKDVELNKQPEIGKPWLNIYLKQNENEIKLRQSSKINVDFSSPIKFYSSLTKNKLDETTYRCEYKIYEGDQTNVIHVIKRNEMECQKSKRLVLVLDPEKDIFSKDYDPSKIYFQGLVKVGDTLVSSINVKLDFIYHLSDLHFSLNNPIISLSSSSSQNDLEFHFHSDYTCDNCMVFAISSDQCSPFLMFKGERAINRIDLIVNDPSEICIIVYKDNKVEVLKWEDIRSDVEKILEIYPSLNIEGNSNQDPSLKNVSLDISPILNALSQDLENVIFSYCIGNQELCNINSYWHSIQINSPVTYLQVPDGTLYYYTAINFKGEIYHTEIKEFGIS